MCKSSSVYVGDRTNSLQRMRARGEGGNTLEVRERMDSSPRLFRIGEVIRESGLSRQTVHNYTSFGLITEAARTPAGHRLYDESVFERLEHIEELKGQRMTLQEIREHLEREERERGEQGPEGGEEGARGR